MSIIREFTLYLHAGITTPEVIHANQYSQGETWIFKLLQDDGSVYVPSTGALIGVKADGHAIAGLTGTVLGDGRVSITTTQQLTAAAGDATCELTIDGGTNGSANFVIRVEKKPTDEAILSESDLSIIQQGLNSVTPAAINESVSNYLEENLTDPPIDPSLSISNAAADAKVTGDKITELKTAIRKINNEFVRTNLFDKSDAEIISVMGNASGALVSGGGVSSVAIPVEPSTQYTLSFWGGNRRLLWETEVYPAVGGSWVVNDGEMSVSSETVEGNSRYYKTLTTGETTHYILLYFYTESTGAETVLNNIQLEYGAVMSEFEDYGKFTMPNLVIEGVPQYEYTNLFNKASAENVMLAINSETLQFVTGGGVSSTIFNCKPETDYTIAWKGIDSASRFFVGTSASRPVLNGYASARYELTDIADDGRRYKTITTGTTDKYLLLWYYSETTGGDETLNTIQINEGTDLLDYTNYGIIIDGLNVNTESLYGDPVSLDFMPTYIINLAGYRALGALDKGYICLVADDGTSDIAAVSYSIVQNKNVPITFALWSTSACITDPTLFSGLQNMISNYGCSVAQHGVGNFATGYTTQSLIDYLNAEKEAWQTIGIEPQGLVYPNHGNNAMVRTICGSDYGVCCTGGASVNKENVYANDTLGTRSNMFALYRVSTYSTSETALKAACDYAFANNKLLIIWWHDNDIVNEPSQIAKINNVIDYALAKGLTFVNVGDIKSL